MQPRVSTAAVALAVAFMAASLLYDVKARPMHAAIVSKYHRYLEEKETITAELKEWLSVYGPSGPKNGYIPVTESRSLDDDFENQRQRSFLTKEQISEARAANPLALFSTDGPFTLMTMEEFKEFFSNSHVSDSDKPKTLSASEKKNTSSSEESKNRGNHERNNNDKEKPKNNDKDKKAWAPATKGTVVVPMVRRLRDAGENQYVYNNGGDYNTNGFQGTSATYVQPSQQTYQTQPSQQIYSASTDSNGGNTNGGWNFGDISTGDSAVVGQVSDGGGSNRYNTGNWWGANGWGVNGNYWWNTWRNDGSNTESGNQQWTQPPSAIQPSSFNNQWTPPSNKQWTEPPSSISINNQQVAESPQTAPAPNAPVPDPPTPAIKAPVTDPPVTAAPATKAPAPAAPVTKRKSTRHHSAAPKTTVKNSDSDSVDWSTSGCVNPPRLQGECGSCWAFASIGALEAAQCIANGDKKAPAYSEQQLVSCNTKNYGCNGGAPVYAMAYLRDNGVCAKSAYPYTSVEGGTAAACTKSCTPIKSGITDIIHLKFGDERALLNSVKKQPVIVSVVSNNAAWKQYAGGVITSCDGTTVDHAVLAVGYDATTIKIKNSWGTDWGEDGFVRISRITQGMGTCAVLTDMSYLKV